MGTYAYICCHVNAVYIKPTHVNNGSNKMHHLSYRGDLGRLVLHLMTYGEPRWHGVETVTDNTHDYEHVANNYTDITDQAIQRYNEFHEDLSLEDLKLKYTPKG